MFSIRLHQLVFLLLLHCFLLCLGPVNARPTVTRQVTDSKGRSTTVLTVHTADTVAGPMTETCVVTLTPITDQNGKPAVEEVRKCSITINANPQNNGSGDGNSSSNSTSVNETLPATASSVSSSVSSSSASSSVETSPLSSSVSSFSASSSVETSPLSSSASSSSASSSPTLPSPASPTPTSSSTASVSTTASDSIVSSAVSGTLPTNGGAGASVNGVTTVSGTAVPTGVASTPSDSPTTASSDAASTIASASASASAAAAEQASGSSSAAFAIGGKKLSVLPIGLGVFAGISVIALIVVGLVTYERTKYRKAFRQRKLAESGAGMAYGGMVQRS